MRMADVWNASLHSQQGLPAALQHLENNAIYNASNVMAQVSGKSHTVQSLVVLNNILIPELCGSALALA